MIPALLGLAVYALVIAILRQARREVMDFLAMHASMDDERSLTAFRMLARRNMKRVPLVVALYFVALALTAQLVLVDSVTGLATLLLVNVLVVWLALRLNRVEKRARALPVADPVLAVEYRQVADAWLNGLWPRF